ncbi:MAG: LPS assembly protein LptD [Pseudomonadota bacterium]
MTSREPKGSAQPRLRLGKVASAAALAAPLGLSAAHGQTPELSNSQAGNTGAAVETDARATTVDQLRGLDGEATGAPPLRLSPEPAASPGGAKSVRSSRPAKRPAQSPPQSPPQSEDETVLFEADSVVRHETDGPIIAEGDVRAYFGERFLRADRLVYDPAKDVVYAEGNVTITDETLETVFAGKVRLTGDLRDGVATNFSALLAENARVAAETGVREQGARTRFRKAVYTACEVCREDGTGKKPTWRVKALKVVRDEERQAIRFHHAFLELKGVPVFYSPYLQGPDPAVERQSGLLSPRVGQDTRQGFNIEVPYYFAISNTQDATFFPRYTSLDGILWQGEYRRRDDNAFNVINGGIIDFENQEDDPGAPDIRWHVFARGVREFGPHVKVGYDVERVSDDFYLRRYNILRRGDLKKDLDTTRANRLTSTGFVDYRKDGHHLRAEGFVFQELRNRAENFDELNPYVLPRIDYEKRGWKVAGGEAYVRANLTALQRTGGLDSRRLTAAAGWEAETVTKGGHRFRAFAEARGDIITYDDIDQGDEASRGAALAAFDAGETSDLAGRFAPTVGVEWSYPLVKHTRHFSLFIEPRVQLVASLAGLNDPDIINEDSRSIDFDFAGLFDPNKSPGFDAFEDGQRVNIGISAAATTRFGFAMEGEIGQQFRAQQTLAFTSDRPLDGSEPNFPNGLGDERSDIVGALNIRYRNIIGVDSRFRMTQDFGDFTRIESFAYLNAWRFRTSATYARLADVDDASGLTAREEITPAVTFRMSDNWRTSFSWRQDLTQDRLIQQTFGLAYQDDCALFSLSYVRDRTNDRTLQQNNAVRLQFTLRTLVE